MMDLQVFSFLFAKSKFRMGVWQRIPRLRICMAILCIVIVFVSQQSQASCIRDSDCGAEHVCESGECQCAPGWTGDRCDHCQGRTSLLDRTGFIIEAVDRYAVRSKCTWLIDAGRPGAIIRLMPIEFGTECSWDYLFIYDGDSVYSPLVASLNGPIRHGSVDIKQEIFTRSGFAYLYFYSDAAFDLDGFNISYSIESCPGNGCSGHGACDPYHLNCSCEPLWLGERCDIPACPNNCSGLGQCDVSSHSCICPSGFKGRDCATLEEDGLWEIKEGVINQGRASAGAILVGDDLWVLGGYTFLEQENMTITRFNVARGTSEVLQTNSVSGDTPKPRYSHTAVLYQDNFLVYGGSLHGSSLTKELWSLHYPSRTWSKLHDGPQTLEGHTAHVVGDVMLVIFGYSPLYGYLNTVQEYNMTSGNWSVVQSRGAPVKGAYGHSSVYDPVGMKIYVHGGYKLRSGSEHMLSDDTYRYDVVTKSWIILKHSSLPRFFHSAVILNGLMLVFGGNTHTDGTQSTGAKCYSSNFLAYNLDCGSWEMLNMSSGLEKEVSRFGHTSFVYQGSMWIYSGYNGLLTTSALQYIPGNCSVITNSSECVRGLLGLWCVWDIASQRCEPVNSVPGLAGNHSICPIEDGPECGQITSCGTCVATPGCGWCHGNCSSNCEDEVTSRECKLASCTTHTNCWMCESEEDCRWTAAGCQHVATSANPASCKDPCEVHTDCSSCLPKSNSNCMWCASQQRCIDSSTYMTSFPFGLCLEWRTTVESCPSTCSDHQTCGECQADPACGWCDSGDRTGLGNCLEGGFSGPINVEGREPALDHGLCPELRWYFIDCPSCQCNGHSQCPQNSSECGLCEDFMEGDHCETCRLGYYGRPQNGGSCTKCNCNGHSEYCHQTTGECFCDAKGIVGNNCDRCDSGSKYFGDPKDGGYCYYQLLMNWQYTFNLSDDEDANYTNIAMMTSPSSPNRDIEFLLRVSKPCFLNITYTANEIDGEQAVVEGRVIESSFKMKLSRYDYDFSTSGNTTFFIYLSNFTTPFSFQISLVKVYPPDDVETTGDSVVTIEPVEEEGTPAEIFVVIFGVALTVMVLVIVLSFALFAVKIAFSICSRRRGDRQRAVELAVMASRPFATVNLEVSKSAPPDLVAECQNYQLLITLEPCSDNKAGIMTVLMQLPLVDGDASPFGQPRLTLASALVQIKPKKSEVREQREREREQREREREQRERERDQEARVTEQELEAQRQRTLPVAPLAELLPDDPTMVATVPPAMPDDRRHIRHHAEYDNPAMV